ncbi:MAG: hypothetical protein NC434_01425 [Ruminococcus sp.]|nr:hypothetical protein [Ruminococcus sp.]
MDYQNYKNLLEKYDQLDAVGFHPGETKEELIQKLMDISREKKQIQLESNEIIKEYVTKYEKEPGLVDADAEKTLTGFLDMLLSNPGQILDPPIAFRLSRILFHYYRSKNNLEQSVLMLERCTVLDIILKEHLDDYPGTSYNPVIEEYLPMFDQLSKRSRHALANCRLLSVINRKDMTFGLKQYRKVETEYATMCEKMNDQSMYPQYVMCKANALAFALEACRRTEYAVKNGLPLKENPIDLETEAPLIARLGKELEEVLAREDVQDIIADRVVIHIYCAQAAYHTGALTIHELLARLEEYSRPDPEHNAIEQCSALFTANAYYMDYLYKSGQFEEKYVLDKSIEIVTQVLTASKKMVHQFGNYQINHCVLMLINSVSGIVPFSLFKSTVLDATVYANKALFVHTMTIKEIALVLLEYILTHDPAYLDGVAGYDADYCKTHPGQMLELMENCALFHDIGKYFCLDYVSNSSRNLTDDEFEIIKAHPVNFSKIYQGRMNPEMACIHDCALLHHLWYNEQGGYPPEKHTLNKPFINILSIADSIDAATDNIGRPYGQGKTLAMLMEEFDASKDTRYSAYVAELLHIEEVRHQVEYIILEKRKDIYYEIYKAKAEEESPPNNS